MSLLLDAKAVQALLNNEFELHCLDIRLERQSPSDPHVLSGAGVIRQDSTGQLHLTLYAPGQMDSRQMFKMWPLGRVIPYEGYYSLRAVSVQGQVWTSSRLQPDQQGAVGGTGVVVVAKLPYLTTETDHATNGSSAPVISRERRNQRSREFLVFSDLELPVNEKTVVATSGGGNRSESHVSNIAIFRAANRRFVVTREQRFTRIQILASADEFPPDFVYHVAHALEFILAAPVTPQVIITREETREVVRIAGARDSDRWQSILPPPIPTNIENAFQHWWRLFDCYLQHVTSKKEAAPHRLSAQWRGLLRASAGAVETLALVASVAVERLIAITAKKINVSRPGDSEAVGWSEKIVRFLEDAECPPDTSKRLVKLLGLVRQSRAIDKLYALADQGTVDRSSVDTWDKVRNAVAHGSYASLGGPEQLLYQCEEVVSLAYQLVFRAIRYEGPYIHFGQAGWRLAKYGAALEPSKPRVLIDGHDG